MAQDTLYTDTLETPMGIFRIVATDRGLREINFPGWTGKTAAVRAEPRANAVIAQAQRQLAGYFDGALRTFDLPRDAEGTPFQHAVWDLLTAIPYGETDTYGALAKRLGRPSASRAVGAANGRNPLPIVVPCHRVIGANGTLTGYAGGLSTKELLLALEQRHAPATGVQVQLGML